MTLLPENSYAPDITQQLSQSVTTLQTAEHQIMLLRRDKCKLELAIKDLMETCPCDPDTTPQFLTACQRAVNLLSK